MQQQRELFQNCNKGKKQQHCAAGRQRATADLCRMTVTTQRTRPFTASTKHNHIVFTGRHVHYIHAL